MTDKEIFELSNKYKKEVDDQGFGVYSEKQIADMMGLSVIEMRKARNRHLYVEYNEQVKTAKDLAEKGHTIGEIAEKMGLSERYIRSLFK